MLPEIGWLSQSGFPVLSALLLIPLVGIAGLTQARSPWAAYALGLVTTLAELGLSLLLLGKFHSGLPHLQFVERHGMGGLGYFLGIDGISILFIPLTALLALLAVVHVRASRPGHRLALIANILLLEWSLLGTFTSLNLLQFWFFGLIELIPTSYLIYRFSANRNERTPTLFHFLKFRLFGEALILVAIVILGWQMAITMPGAWSFNLEHLIERPRSHAWDSRLCLILFYGFAVRLALFPFHAWLPTVAAAGTPAINLMFMVGLKVGAYALLRFVFPLVPEAVEAWDHWAVALGLAGMVYGALLALLQVDLRRLIAFAAISETGAVLVAMFALNPTGLQGGLLLTLNLGLATAGLFLATDLLYQRTGTTRLDQLGGLFDRLPLLGLVFLAATLGTLAMPGTPGFEAAHLALEGMLESFHWSAAYGAAAGNVLVASVLLWAYQRIFFTRATDTGRAAPVDLLGRERWLAGGLCAVIFGVGLYAHPWIETVSASLEHLAQATEQTATADRERE